MTDQELALTIDQVTRRAATTHRVYDLMDRLPGFSEETARLDDEQLAFRAARAMLELERRMEAAAA